MTIASNVCVRNESLCTAMINDGADRLAEASKYRQEFYIMAIAFGLNHATVTTPLQFATSVLTQKVGYASNLSLYAATLVCSLFFANIIYSRLGAKTGLSIAMLLYTVYSGSFGLAIFLCPHKSDDGSCIEGSATGAMWLVAVLGALLGGVGAGLLWTCQGAFYALVCEKIAQAEDRSKEKVTAEFSGTFGLIFLGFEAGVRAVTSLLTQSSADGIGLGLQQWVAFAIWTFAALASTVGFSAFSTNLASAAPQGGILDKVLAATNLWKDPKLWLLQATNVTFGFAAAYNAGFVNSNITSKALKKQGGATFIGYGGAVLSLLAAILAKLAGPVAAKYGKGPVVAIGALAFLLIAIFSYIMRQDPEKYGFGVLIFYVLMGIGRAVYETTNKAIFADFFPGDKAPGAFANVFVFGTLASVVTYGLGIAAGSSSEAPEYTIMSGCLLLFAAITLPCYKGALTLKNAADKRDQSQQPLNSS
eukprot:TRINITY_DN75111_c0_g1_i1.p1 TRINITY_DN75111_c0_g1~~TRINITY_DN75111_c0_g1_i1.p1  ORF type:complete len:476 (-),score=85.63 TRINITY_DN75111_c0_g1_i1:66-1493(-)